MNHQGKANASNSWLFRCRLKYLLNQSGASFRVIYPAEFVNVTSVREYFWL